MAVKRNNVIPFGHFHKDWQRFIKTWFSQPCRKVKRRLIRSEKARKMAPRPVHPLKPEVRCPTVRYQGKLKLGRGFTFNEVRRANLPVKFARTIGIVVDHRRRNKSVETLLGNVQRLRDYRANLILLPFKKSKKQKKDEGSESEIKLATQIVTPIPLKKTSVKILSRIIAEDEKSFCCFSALRKARSDVKMQGTRMKRLKKAAEEKFNQ